MSWRALLPVSFFLMLGCTAVTAPPLTGVYKKMKVGSQVYEYRYISCAPAVKFENNVAILEHVEVAGITDLTIRTVSEEERRFFVALGLFNNWMVLTCQTITLIGANPELVVQYSKTRDEIVMAFLQDYALRRTIGATASLNYDVLTRRIQTSAYQTEKLIPLGEMLAHVPKVFDPTRGDA